MSKHTLFPTVVPSVVCATHSLPPEQPVPPPMYSTPTPVNQKGSVHFCGKAPLPEQQLPAFSEDAPCLQLVGIYAGAAGAGVL